MGLTRKELLFSEGLTIYFMEGSTLCYTVFWRIFMKIYSLRFVRQQIYLLQGAGTDKLDLSGETGVDF